MSLHDDVDREMALIGVRYMRRAMNRLFDEIENRNNGAPAAIAAPAAPQWPLGRVGLVAPTPEKTAQRGRPRKPPMLADAQRAMSAPAKPATPKPKRTMSAAGRKAMKAAQKRRWDKYREQQAAEAAAQQGT